LWSLYQHFWDKEEGYALRIVVNFNELFDDTYEIEEILGITIVDTPISKFRRNIKAFF